MPSTAEQRPSGSALVLALDLGGTHLRTAVVAADGTLTTRQRIRSPMAAGVDAVVAHAFRVQASRVRIVPTVLGDDVALVGALPLVAFAV